MLTKALFILMTFSSYTKNVGTFINIVDGDITPIEEKYLVAKNVSFKGHYAITSNEHIETS